MSATVAAFGEALWDMLPSGAKLGGAPLNFAYRIQSLGHRGVIISRLGRDELGERAFRQIESLGMETEFIQWDDHRPTGTVNVTLDESKTPDFEIVPDVAYDSIEANEAVRSLTAESTCLYFGTLIQRADGSRRTLRELAERFSGRFVLVDINLRKNCYSRQSVLFSLDRADILKVSQQEVEEIADLAGMRGRSIPDFTREFIQRTRGSYCVVTMGRWGAFAGSRSGELLYQPTYAAEVVDTTGSGDAFTAGFLHGLLAGQPLRRACQFGNAMGALVAGQEGATQVVEAEEAERMIRRGELEESDPELAAYQR